jgi:hypothetical protein
MDRVTTFDVKKIKIENIHTLLLHFPCYFSVYEITISAYVRIFFVFLVFFFFFPIQIWGERKGKIRQDKTQKSKQPKQPKINHRTALKQINTLISMNGSN